MENSLEQLLKEIIHTFDFMEEENDEDPDLYEEEEEDDLDDDDLYDENESDALSHISDEVSQYFETHNLHQKKGYHQTDRSS